MAKDFTPDEWDRIGATLAAAPGRYGLPERRAGSAVLASFNIRKLGTSDGKTDGAFDMLARFCAQCDLIAVQEVLARLDGLERLRRETAALAGAPFDLVCSDVTGGVTGGRGMEERLAFLYRPDRVRRGPVVGDISYDRTAVFQSLYLNREDFLAETVTFDKKMRRHLEAEIAKLEWELGPKTDPKPRGVGKPRFHAPHFAGFIRTPHCAAFEIAGAPGTTPLRFTAVNAHLLYGGDGRRERIERENEFNALVHWLLERAASDNSHNLDHILLGDLNLAFDSATDDRRAEIVARIKGLNDALTARGAAKTVNFPFLDARENPITGARQIIRTNARLDETFDQIGIFAHDDRLPGYDANPHVADRADADAFDYGCFDFVNLFAEAITGGTVGALDDDAADDFIARFQHDVSDHMPIWVRLKLPA